MTTNEIRQQVAIDGALLSAANVGGTKYEIFDNDARIGVKANSELIDQISGMIQGGVHYLGKSATELSDGSTTQTINVYVGSGTETSSVTAADGDMVSYTPAGEGKKDLEFIWGSNRWNEFGSSGALKALAFKDEAEGTYTPAGGVTLTNTDKTASLTNASATAAALTGLTATTTASYTPNGSVSIDYTPTGSVALGEYTPEGGVVIPSIAPSAKAITVTEPTGTGTFTPGTKTQSFSGSITALPTLTANAPEVTVTPSTTGVLATATVADGVLSFGSTNVLTGATAALNAAPSVGYSTTADATQDLGSNAIAISTTGTVLSGGTVSVATTTETKSITINELTNVAGTFTGTTANLGTKDISGTAVELTANLAGTKATIAGTATVQNFTPQITAITGDVTIAVPTSAAFAGTAATITVS